MCAAGVGSLLSEVVEDVLIISDDSRISFENIDLEERR